MSQIFDFEEKVFINHESLRFNPIVKKIIDLLVKQKYSTNILKFSTKEVSDFV